MEKPRATAPRVTVVVPCFNYARFLPTALDSVLAQSYPHWECIVVDDGSTDETTEVAQGWIQRDPRFRLVTTANRGPSAARNEALRSSSAEFVQFLDADDRLAVEKLEKHVSYLDANPETEIVYGHVGYFTTENPETVLNSPFGRLSQPMTDRVHGSEEALQKLEHYNFLAILATMVRRSVFPKVGLFEESVIASEDWIFWLNCAVLGCRFDYDGSGHAVATVRTHQKSARRVQGKILRGVIDAAHAFENGASISVWRRSHKRLPLFIEFGLGVETIENGARLEGYRRIAKAAREATERLTGLRWRIYGIAGLLFPKRVFIWFITLPIPEELLEMYRWAQRSLKSGSRRTEAGGDSA